MRALILLLACTLTALAASAQESPIVGWKVDNGAFFLVHANGAETSAAVRGPVIINTEESNSIPPSDEQDITGGDVTVVTTKWTDAQGVEHSVSTPIPSTSETSMRSSYRRHLFMVRIAQEEFPPRPVRVP